VQIQGKSSNALSASFPATHTQPGFSCFDERSEARLRPTYHGITCTKIIAKRSFNIRKSTDHCINVLSKERRQCRDQALRRQLFCVSSSTLYTSLDFNCFDEKLKASLSDNTREPRWSHPPPRSE